MTRESPPIRVAAVANLNHPGKRGLERRAHRVQPVDAGDGA